MPFLNLNSLILAHGDSAGNAPSLRYCDWKRSQVGIEVKNPESKSVLVEPGQEVLVFDGAKATDIDGTTQFRVSLSPLASSRYRFTHSTGTAPGFRVAKLKSLTGIALTLTANANGTLSVVAGSETPFAGLAAGDVAFIPGVTTGDASAGFNPSNEGEWSILSASDTALTLMRPLGQDFVGVSETVTPASDVVLFYGSAGIQVGDKFDLSAGFSLPNLKTYTVTAVTCSWVEVTSTSPLALEVATPGATGMKFYRGSKRWIRLESDQDCVVRVNGDTGSSQRLSPWLAGDEKMVGEYVRTGPTWALRLLNKAPVAANVLVISVE